MKNWQRRRVWSGGLLAVWLVMLLAGCAETATPTPVVTPNNTALPVPLNTHLAAQPPSNLTVWLADDYYNEPPLVDLVKNFHLAYPKIVVTVQHYEWNKMRNKIKDAVGAGQPPDIAHQHAFVFGAQGFAEPLDDLWQQWGGAASAAFLPNALGDVTWRGVRYGVPLDINTVFLIYNKQMFEEAGLPLPGDDYTYTKLLKDARKLTSPDANRYGIAFKPGSWDTFGLVCSNGGELLSTQPGKLPTTELDNPSNVQILQFVSDMINKEKVSPPPIFSNGPDPVTLFEQRKIATFFSGPWDLKEIEKNGSNGLYDQVGTASMPNGISGGTVGSVQGGGSLFVPKGAKNREAAFEFMKWASSPEYQMRLAREMGRYPILSGLYSDPFFTAQPLLKPYLAQLKTARPYTLEAYSQADITWEQSVAAILTGADAKTTLQDGNRAAQVAVNNAPSP